jgi:hypothetical protein
VNGAICQSKIREELLIATVTIKEFPSCREESWHRKSLLLVFLLLAP